MAKKSHTPTPRKDRPETKSLQTEVAFRRFWVTRAGMRELSKADAREEGPTSEQPPFELAIAVRVMVSEDKVGRVVLKISVNGARTTKPYQVEVELVGEFAAREGSREAIEAFCRDAGPTLLFPYARQIIDRLTSDGFYGAIRLDPIYLRQMLAAQRWESDESRRHSASKKVAGPIETERRG